MVLNLLQFLLILFGNDLLDNYGFLPIWDLRMRNCHSVFKLSLIIFRLFFTRLSKCTSFKNVFREPINQPGPNSTEIIVDNKLKICWIRANSVPEIRGVGVCVFWDKFWDKMVVDIARFARLKMCNVLKSIIVLFCSVLFDKVNK